MSLAEIGAYGEELYQQVLPLHGPDPDGLTHDLVGAWTHGVREIDELVRDTPRGPGWSVILDVDDAPVKGLYWLSQIAGVTLRQPKLVTYFNLVNSLTERSGSFEDDISAWSYPSTTQTKVIGGTRGQYALQGVASANATVGASFQAAVGGLSRITVAVDVISAARPVSLQVAWSDGAFTPISTVTEAASAATGRRSMTVQAPSSAEFAGFRLVMPGALIGEAFVIDAYSAITPYGSSVYFDGSVATHVESDEEWAVYARDAIRRQGGRNRGTPDAILSAAEDTLTGTRQARLIERVGGNAYRFTLITRPSETPDPDLTLARASAQVPAGSKLTLTLTEGATIDEGTKTIDAATATIDTATLSDIAN